MVDADGYITLVDRLKDMIITGGRNVYSVEVENALAGHPGLLDVAVIGVPHPDYGESILAVIVPADGAELDGVAARVGSRPDRGLQGPAQRGAPIPRNPSGKIQKHLLRADSRLQAARADWPDDRPGQTRVLSGAQPVDQLEHGLGRHRVVRGAEVDDEEDVGASTVTSVFRFSEMPGRPEKSTPWLSLNAGCLPTLVLAMDFSVVSGAARARRRCR